MKIYEVLFDAEHGKEDVKRFVSREEAKLFASDRTWHGLPATVDGHNVPRAKDDQCKLIGRAEITVALSPEVKGNDLIAEGAMSLSRAARFVPALDGKPPNPSTVWRWAMVGIRGVRLEYTRVGRKIATSKPALIRFFAALAAADTPSPRSGAKGRTAAQRQRDIEAAEATCKKFGI